MDNKSLKLLLIGCGHMGGAMLRGWRKENPDLSVVVVDPKYQGEENHVPAHTKLPKDYHADIVLLAVPPQIADVALDGLSQRITADTLVISIMAGKSLSWLSERLQQHPLLVRVMPNLPVAIGRGVCGYYTPATLSPKQQDILHNLLNAAGKAVAVESEDQINIVTAVSGSGPAYVFLLIEAMMNAGIKAGLSKEISEELARQTVAGSGQYALGSAHSAHELLSHIAVKGGTTEAALGRLTHGDTFQTLFDEAIEIATNRARELAI